MPLIEAHQIGDLIALFNGRDALLPHGCQLRDLRSYLKLGGVPSRASLIGAGLPFTAFQTDAIDQTNGVWDKVFFNLSDFGHWFAFGKRSLPNPYGPILLVFEPSVLATATNVSLSLRSAGANGFDRVSESLSLEEVPNLFADNAGAKRHIKFTEALKATYPGRTVDGNPEMNCVYPNGVAPIARLRYIIVDHYTQGGLGLDDAVRHSLATHGITRKVIKRMVKPERLACYCSLWDAIAGGVCTLEQLLAVGGLDQATVDWATSALEWDNDSFQFGRFCSYLRSGTVNEPFR